MENYFFIHCTLAESCPYEQCRYARGRNAHDQQTWGYSRITKAEILHSLNLPGKILLFSTIMITAFKLTFLCLMA